MLAEDTSQLAALMVDEERNGKVRNKVSHRGVFIRGSICLKKHRWTDCKVSPTCVQTSKLAVNLQAAKIAGIDTSVVPNSQTVSVNGNFQEKKQGI